MRRKLQIPRIETTEEIPIRPLSVIAAEITKDWKRVNFAACPYLEAMGQLNKITDVYIAESGYSIVPYFLSNAGSWTGPVAQKIKKN